VKVVIIEDEKLLQQELALQLDKIGDIEVAHYLTSVSESVEWLKMNANNIDLIFMDIELADGVSFEIFDLVEISLPVIFLTAYSEYAIQAFKVNSIDYLLKPVNLSDLIFALDKFKKQTKANTAFDATVFKDFYVQSGVNKNQRILIQSGDNFKYLDQDEIAYFVAEDKYVTVVTFENTKHLIDESLNKLEETLPIDVFYRPTRQFIINIKAINKATKYFNSRLKLYIDPSPDSEIIISRNKVKDFLDWMGN